MTLVTTELSTAQKPQHGRDFHKAQQTCDLGQSKGCDLCAWFLSCTSYPWGHCGHSETEGGWWAANTQGLRTGGHRPQKRPREGANLTCCRPQAQPCSPTRAWRAHASGVGSTGSGSARTIGSHPHAAHPGTLRPAHTEEPRLACREPVGWCGSWGCGAGRWPLTFSWVRMSSCWRREARFSVTL